MNILSFHLMGNAMDSLEQGIGFVLKENPSESNLKLSILLIAQSVELLLKERLRREHWSLVFKEVEKAGNRDATTVTIGEAIKRLEKIAHVNFVPGEKDTITALSEIRNQVQHYEINITYEEVIAKTHAAIAVITRLLKDELNEDIREYISADDLDRFWLVGEALKHLQEIARQNIEKLREELAPRDASDLINWQFDVIECPRCWEEFYVFSPEENISQCQLCKFEGGFVECSRCGFQAPSGSWDFHSENEEYALCENCWAYEKEQ